MDQTVTRAAFRIAFSTGDLSTIHAYLAQPHVQEEVQATNDHVRETRLTDARRFTLSDGTIPWFNSPWQLQQDSIDEMPLLTAAQHGHAHVLAWFFLREATAFLGSETLVLLLPRVARFDTDYDWRSWDEDVPASDPLVLETLFMSYVFCDVITDDHEKQRILDETVGVCETPSAVAIAHGACVNTALPRIARSCKVSCAKMLEATGAFLVGSEIIDSKFGYWDYHHSRSYLAHGVDSRGAEQLMIETVTRIQDEKEVKALLAGGFLDVDARDDGGKTALIRVANLNPRMDFHPHYPDWTVEIASALLAFCDVNLIDNRGRTALHCAVERNHPVAMILLNNGADATIRDHREFAALDLLDERSLQLVGRELLEQLLEAGADAFAVPPTPDQPPISADDADSRVGAHEDRLSLPNGTAFSPRSLHDRLNETARGRSFIQMHPQYFQRDSIH